MVKNKKGGKKTKSMGRKFVGMPLKKLRVIEEEGETYAAVIKMLGNGMAEVQDLNGTLYICIIRQKFKGRGKKRQSTMYGKLDFDRHPGLGNCQS